MSNSEILYLKGKDLTVEEICQVVFDHRKVAIDPEVIPRVKEARQLLFDMAAQGQGVYGLNRGVGWNKDKEFSPEYFEQYNRNLLNSHSLGVEPYASVEEVRAMMCIRLNHALCCCTGMSLEIMEMYVEFLNRGIHPRAFARGAVGEGDVSTLSLIGQSIIGNGEVEYKGQIVPTMEALNKEGIKPAVLGPKDGLSIVSSGAQCESIVLLVIKEALEIIKISDAVYCLGLEGLNGGLQPLYHKVNELRGFKGQIECAARCRGWLEGSYLEQPDPNRALQDALSFRCSAAVNGSVLDALNYVKEQFTISVNHTDDNPCLILEERRASVSPNFEVTTLALGVDMLAAALCHISRNVSNRLFKLADPDFTGLERFLTIGGGVTTIGFSTIQKTFSALNAENRWLSNTTSTDCEPLSGYIEDHASNLALAATRTLKIIDNLRYMIGIELIHAAQAVDMRGVSDKLGRGTDKLYKEFRKEITYLETDRNLSVDMKKAYDFIKEGRVLKAMGDV